MNKKRLFRGVFQKGGILSEIFVVFELCQKNCFHSDHKKCPFTRNVDSLRDMAKNDFFTEFMILS